MNYKLLRTADRRVRQAQYRSPFRDGTFGFAPCLLRANPTSTTLSWNVGSRARLRPTLFNVPLSMSAWCFSARHWADRIGARKFKLRHYLCRNHHLSNTRPGVAHQGIARCVSPLHERPMPKPHPFATAPATKGRARTVPKPNVTVYSYARVSTGGQSVDAGHRRISVEAAPAPVDRGCERRDQRPGVRPSAR